MVEANPAVSPAFGIHPWRVSSEEVAHSLERLPELLSSIPKAWVGEIGLDGCKGRPPMPLQRRFLHRQLALARQFQRSAVVHLVHAWEDGWSVLREFDDVSVVLHGFHGSEGVLRRFLSLPRVRFSLGFDVLAPAPRFAAAIRAIPADRLLVESDWPFRGHSPAELPALLSTIAKIRGDHDCNSEPNLSLTT